MILFDVQSEMRIWRGARPKTFEEFRDLKVNTFINLQSGWFEFVNRKCYELDVWAAELNRTMIHLPLSDFTAPTDAQYAVFKREMLEAVARGPVFFGCLHGKDRTGIMGARWRRDVNRWSREKAIDEMFIHGFHKFPYMPWVRSVK